MDPGTRQPELIQVLSLMLGPSSKPLLAEQSIKKVGTCLCSRLSKHLKNKTKPLVTSGQKQKLEAIPFNTTLTLGKSLYLLKTTFLHLETGLTTVTIPWI